MKALVERAGYPLILAAAIGAQSFLLQTDLPVGVSLTGVVAASMAVIWLLERGMPYAAEWAPSWRLLRLDLMHSLVSASAVSQIVRAILAGVLATAGAWLAAAVGTSLWPVDAPLWLQVPLAIVVCDFGVYWAHRWMHISRTGWRVHAVHHSPTKLYFMASGRSHPFNAALSHSSEILPLILLGAGPELFVIWTVFKSVNGVLQHSNVDFRPGWLNRILATNEQHWYHHAQEWTPSNSNFGNTTMIWDQIFGTYYNSGTRPSTVVGIEGAQIPETYLAHLGVPFKLREYQPGFDQAPEDR